MSNNIKKSKIRKFEQKKLRNEAEEAGVKIIGKGEKRSYYMCEFIQCHHQQEIRLDKIKNKHFQCRKCQEEKLENEAKQAGLTLLRKGRRNAHYRIYEFNKCHHRQELRTDAVRAGNIRCEQCQEEKLKKEAQDVGLELIGGGRDNHWRKYRFLSCSHIQEIAVSCVRSGSFRCEQCQEEKIRQEAEEVSLKLIGQGKDCNYRIYEFNSCHHKQEIQITNVRHKQFKCQTCLEECIKQEAEEMGLKVVGRGKTFEFRTYEFNECHHQQEIRVACVRSGSFRCRQCLEEKLENEAEQAGLKLIGQGKNHHYRMYEISSCHHQQEMEISNVRNGQFKCKVCNGLYTNKGVLVKSNLEKTVGDWLEKNNIEYIYEKRLSKKTRHKTDFYLIRYGIYIEVAGYDKDFRGYLTKLNNKITQFYHNKKLIVIYYDDIINQRWEGIVYRAMHNCNNNDYFKILSALFRIEIANMMGIE